jgi:hypothetical protein
MFTRFRPRLTFANVVSVLALFVALGGSASAAIIVSSNSQVAKNTISGHHPPSGDHPNLIAGSVNGTDVLASTLGKVPSAAKAGNGAVSINKPNLGFIGSGVLGGPFNGVTATFDCKKAFVEVGLSVKAGDVFVSGDQAADGTLSSVQVAQPGGYVAAANGTVNLDVIASDDGTGKWTRFDLGGFHGATGCNFWGVAIPGS